jgi:ribosomal protein S18 acetylase RimI-like enzyme
MKIREVKRFTRATFRAVERLLPQLDRDAEVLTEGKLKLLIRSKDSHLFISVTEEKQVTGMLTAIVYFVPTGMKFWIEDVVVDEAFRGKGVGKDLMLHAMEFARSNNAKSVNLTSRPTRVAANKLYQDLGFDLRETNVYRYRIR